MRKNKQKHYSKFFVWTCSNGWGFIGAEYYDSRFIGKSKKG